jgi:hypothetical protein
VAPGGAVRRKSGDARDDKGKGDGFIESGCWTEAFFIVLGRPTELHVLGGRSSVAGTGSPQRLHIHFLEKAIWDGAHQEHDPRPEPRQVDDITPAVDRFQNAASNLIG